MVSYCLKCRESTNPKNVMMKNGRLMSLLKCAVFDR